MAPRSIRLYITVIGVIGLVVLVAAFLAPLAYSIWRAHASDVWLSTSGTVLESGTHRNARGRVHPSVRFRYTIGGETYAGSTIQLSGEYKGVEQALEIARRFPIGPVLVYYDPNNPEDSQLMPAGSSRVQWFMLGIGSVIFGGGLLMVVLIRRALKTAN